MKIEFKKQNSNLYGAVIFTILSILNAWLGVIISAQYINAVIFQGIVFAMLAVGFLISILDET